MNLFNQIVPRLSRSIRRDEQSAANGGGESDREFVIKPVYEVKENPDAWGLTVQLPGVSKDDLDLTVEEGLVNIRGRRSWKRPEAWTTVWRESADAPFELSLEHDNSVDVEKIHAELKDGVLRVSLPKTEAVKPRKIAVN